MYRYTIPSLVQKLDPFLTWKIKEHKKAIYLTFDDGPDPVVTGWVLDQLEKYGAKATFFCVGDNVRKHPATYQRILEGGHSTGNHTFNHLNGWKTKNESYYSNIAECHQVLPSHLFRPPYGKIGMRQALHLRRQQYRIIMWSILSRDFDQHLDCEESLAAMKKNTGKGSIVLFHDSVKSEKNLRYLLPLFLEHFSGQGYQFYAL